MPQPAGQGRRPSELGPRGPVGGQTLVYLRDALVAPSLRGERLTPVHEPYCQPLCKSLLTRQRHQCLGLLLGCLPLPAQPMEPAAQSQGKRQTKGVRQLVCQGEALLAPLQRLVRIAQHPQGKGRIDPASHARVCP